MHSTYLAPAESTWRSTCSRQLRIVASSSGSPASIQSKFPPQVVPTAERATTRLARDQSWSGITTVESVPQLQPFSGEYHNVGDQLAPLNGEYCNGEDQLPRYASGYHNGSDAVSAAHQPPPPMANGDIVSSAGTLHAAAPDVTANGQPFLLASDVAPNSTSQSSRSSSGSSGTGAGSPAAAEARSSPLGARSTSYAPESLPTSSHPQVDSQLDFLPRPSGPPEPMASPPSTSSPAPQPLLPKKKNKTWRWRRPRRVPTFLRRPPAPADPSLPAPSAPELMSQIVSTPSWHGLHALFHAHRPCFNHHHTSAILHCLLSFQQDPAFPRNVHLQRQAFRILVESILHHATTLVPTYTCVSASTTLYLTARFQLTNRHPTLPAYPLRHSATLITGLLTHTAALLSPPSPTFTPAPYAITPSSGDLPLLLWALTKLTHPPPASWLHPFFAVTTPTLHHCNPTQHALLIYSLGSMHIRPPPAWRDAYLAAVVPAFPRMKALEISIVGWGVARTALRPDAAWLTAFTDSALQLLRPAKQPCSWARVLLALGQFRWRPSRQWAGAFCDCTRELLPTFRPYEVAMILHGMARAGIPPDPMWMDELFELSQQEFRRYHLANLACICWSLRVLREEPPRDWLRRLVWSLAARACDWSAYAENRQLVVALHHFKAVGMHRLRPDVLLLLRSKPRKFHWFLQQVVQHAAQQRDAALQQREQPLTLPARRTASSPLPQHVVPKLETTVERLQRLAQQRAARTASTASALGSNGAGGLTPAVTLSRSPAQRMVTLPSTAVPADDGTSSSSSSTGGSSAATHGAQTPLDGRNNSASSSSSRSSSGDVAVRPASGKKKRAAPRPADAAGTPQGGAGEQAPGQPGDGRILEVRELNAPPRRKSLRYSSGGVQLVGPPVRRVQRAVMEGSAAAAAEEGAS